MPRPTYESTTEVIPWYSVQHGLPDSSGNSVVTTYERGYYGAVTPGYPGVKPLPFNAYGMDVRKRQYGRCQTLAIRDYWGDTYSSYGASAAYGLPQANVEQHIPTDTIFNNGAERKARSKCISAVQRIKVNVAQNVAEYNQVRRMFSTNVDRITQAYRALRRGDVKGFSRWVPLRVRHQQSLLRRGPLNIRRHAPSIWLEAQYGWIPLLSDVYAGVDEFYKRVESGYAIRAKGAGSDLVNDEVKLDGDVGMFVSRDVTSRRYFAKYIVEYEVDHTNLANMDDWGLTNPLLLAWELLPYSFVVDWFLPVGAWLAQVGYSLGLHFRRGMRSGVVRAQTHRVYTAAPGGSYWSTYEASGSDDFSTARFRREILADWPSPVIPSFDKDGLRGKRITNALSLLALAFDRK